MLKKPSNASENTVKVFVIYWKSFLKNLLNDKYIKISIYQFGLLIVFVSFMNILLNRMSERVNIRECGRMQMGEI